MSIACRFQNKSVEQIKRHTALDGSWDALLHMDGSENIGLSRGKNY